MIVPTRPSPHDLRAVGATVDIAERHGKPLIFVINAATARARITGESAVALSQHGMVAPVTIHHRVDFAASMIDGRTVGEVIAQFRFGPGDPRPVALLQDRLSRIKQDAAFAPKVVPQNFAVSGLSSADSSEPADGGGSFGPISSPVPPSPTPEPDPGVERRSGLDRREAAIEPYTGVERRSGLDRREAGGEPRRVFGSGDRPAPPPFGRRNADPGKDASIRESRP